MTITGSMIELTIIRVRTRAMMTFTAGGFLKKLCKLQDIQAGPVVSVVRRSVFPFDLRVLASRES